MADFNWADWLQEELLELGHEVKNHRYDLSSGEDFSVWMDQQLEWADFTLAVYSDDYLAGKWAMREFNEARALSTDTQTNCLLIVVVRQCKMTTATQRLNRAELYGKDKGEARDAFVDYIMRADKSEYRPLDPQFLNPVPFPGRVPHNLPFSAPHRFFKRDTAELFGREDVFEKLRRSFDDDAHSTGVVVLQGLAGTGKSTVAVAYAESKLNLYRTCWWIRAEFEDGIQTDLAQLATQLGWIRPDDSEEIPVDKIMTRLKEDGRGLLLIYDNAIAFESIQRYLPDGGGAHILITSNAGNWKIGE